VSLELRVVVASFSVLCNGIGGRPSSEKSGRGSSPNRWKNLLSSFFSNRKSTKWVAVAALGSTRERENSARKLRAGAWCRSYVFGRDTCEKREIRMCWSSFSFGIVCPFFPRTCMMKWTRGSGSGARHSLTRFGKILESNIWLYDWLAKI
jgi:hypothetical protein